MLPQSFLAQTAAAGFTRTSFAAQPMQTPRYTFTERATAAAAFGRIAVPSPREGIYVPAGKEKNWVESFMKDLAAVRSLRTQLPEPEVPPSCPAAAWGAGAIGPAPLRPGPLGPAPSGLLWSALRGLGAREGFGASQGPCGCVCALLLAC